MERVSLDVSIDDSSPDDGAAQLTRTGPRLGLQDKDKRSPHALTKSALSMLDYDRRTAPTSLEDVSATGRVMSSSHHWKHGHDPSLIDGNLRRVRRYLRSARSLYEIQMQPKRPSALLKMKSNSFGFKNGTTHDVLANLVSPIRSPQVLDSWSPLEIGTFEDAFERSGKDFHAIAQQLPKKTVKDIIAFYYVWKKHGVLTVHHTEGEDSDGGSSEGYYDASMSAETLKHVEKLKRRQRCVRDYLAAARELTCVKRINQVSHRDVSLSEFSLHRLAGLRPAIPSTSNLRNPAVLDTWTPHEIRVFELAMECYGKEEFHQVARMVLRSYSSASKVSRVACCGVPNSFLRCWWKVGTKSCQEVIAFYYVWKKDPYYQVVKSRWEKRDPFSKKKTNATAGANQSG